MTAKRLGADEIGTLTLGTATLGQAYGIANPQALDTAAAAAVLERSAHLGIRAIDTAAAYGVAEERIGAWLARRRGRPVVVSKAPPLRDISDTELASALERHLAGSLARLHRDELDGYLLHHAGDWRRAAIRRWLREQQEAGRIRSVGISAYDPEEALDLLEVETMELIQLPLSLFDRRAAVSGLLERAAAHGVIVFARSLFLQGLLFFDPSRLPPFFEPARPVLEALRLCAEEEGRCSLTALAIRSALDTEEVCSAVVGVYSVEQVDEAVAAAAEPVDAEVVRRAVTIASALPPDLGDPRRWPKST